MIHNRKEAQQIKFLKNEKTLAESLLSSKNEKNKVFTSDYSIKVLAKYYRHVNGFKAREIRAALNAFCQQNYSDYNDATFYTRIERAITFSLNHVLKEQTSINISKSEMDIILNIQAPEGKDKAKIQKILFFVLIQAKLMKAINGYDRKRKNDRDAFYINLSASKIVTLSGSDIRGEDLRASYIKTVCDSGLIAYDDKRKKFKINFIDTNGKSVIEMKHFSKKAIALYWDEYINTVNPTPFHAIVYFRCIRCDIPVLKLSNGQKYCGLCSKLSVNESKKQWKSDNSKVEKSETQQTR